MRTQMETFMILRDQNAARIRELQERGKLSLSINVDTMSSEMAASGRTIPETRENIMGRIP